MATLMQRPGVLKRAQEELDLIVGRERILEESAEDPNVNDVDTRTTVAKVVGTQTTAGKAKRFDSSTTQGGQIVSGHLSNFYWR